MKWFYDLKISTKLISSFLVVLALTAIMGVFAILQLGAVNHAAQDIRGNWMPSMRAAAGMRFFAANYRLKENRNIGTEVAEEKAQAEREAVEARQQFETRLGTYEQLISNDEDRQLLASVKSTWSAYLASSQQLFELSRQNQEAQARGVLRGESKVHFDELTSRLQKMVELNDAGATVAGDKGSALYESSRLLIIVVLGAALLIGLGLALFIARIISRPLRLAASAAEQLAEGNLNTPIAPGSKDETGMVLNAMRNMVGKLALIIGEVRNAADNLASASEQVSATAQSMSQATSEQAASVEETSASVEQMSASINQNTENAKVTDGMASKAAKEATDGGESVQQTVVAMKKSPSASASSMTLPTRPTCSRSTPPSRRHGPASTAKASPWWPPKCANWRSAARSPPRKSANCRPAAWTWRRKPASCSTKWCPPSTRRPTWCRKSAPRPRNRPRVSRRSTRP
jgi:methyl-accepting chemotaxis protein